MTTVWFQSLMAEIIAGRWMARCYYALNVPLTAWQAVLVVRTDIENRYTTVQGSTESGMSPVSIWSALAASASRRPVSPPSSLSVKGAQEKGYVLIRAWPQERIAEEFCAAGSVFVWILPGFLKARVHVLGRGDVCCLPSLDAFMRGLRFA